MLGNPDALLSILGNPLANAVRYTPAGGSVAVRWDRDPGAKTAWVEVRDTGIGIAAEVRDRIFEKFYRAPQAEAVEPRGLGLGLALVRQLVLAHEGDIEVESAAGAGTTFRVRLPAAKAAR